MACARFEARISAPIVVADADGSGSVVGARLIVVRGVFAVDDAGNMEVKPAIDKYAPEDEVPMTDVDTGVMVLCSAEILDGIAEEIGENVSVTKEAVLTAIGTTDTVPWVCKPTLVVATRGNSRDGEAEEVVPRECCVDPLTMLRVEVSPDR